jgi:plastocyanin
MTVVWFNDDRAEHTVTTADNSPERFDSGVIPSGGFSVFTFSKPGTYDYYDKFNPSKRDKLL